MTPRERVLKTLEHEEPDRVPLDIGGGSSTSIVVEAYESLKRHLGMEGKTRVLNRIFRIAKLDEGVMRRLGSDCIPLRMNPPSRKMPATSDPGTFTDIWGVTWRKAFYGEGCHYWELARCPLAEADIGDLEKHSWPDAGDPGFTAGLAEEARSLSRETGYAILADGGFKCFWEQAYMLRGLEQLLVDLVENPDFVTALLSKILEVNLQVTGRFLDAVGPYINAIRASDDLATQQGLLISPRTYRKFLKPVHKEYFDFIRSRTEARIFFHSCGNITELMDDLVEIGVDIINPVQVSAMGDTAALKTRFGGRVVFWGGVDTQRVLPRGTEEDVVLEVRRRIRDLGPGGGFVLAAVHNIQPDVPPGNVIAMAEATRRFGTYPLVDG